MLSSDTRYNQNVIKYGAGADFAGPRGRPELMQEAYIQGIIGHQTTPRETGFVFAQTKPKLAVYTHIVLLGSERISPPTIDDIVAKSGGFFLWVLPRGGSVLGRAAARYNSSLSVISTGY